MVSPGKGYSHQFREFREQHEIRFARIDLRRRPGSCRRPGSLEQECFSEDIRTPTNLNTCNMPQRIYGENPAQNTPISRVRDYPRNVRTADVFIAEWTFFSDGWWSLVRPSSSHLTTASSSLVRSTVPTSPVGFPKFPKPSTRSPGLSAWSVERGAPSGGLLARSESGGAPGCAKGGWGVLRSLGVDLLLMRAIFYRLSSKEACRWSLANHFLPVSRIILERMVGLVKTAQLLQLGLAKMPGSCCWLVIKTSHWKSRAARGMDQTPFPRRLREPIQSQNRDVQLISTNVQLCTVGLVVFL